MKQAEAFNVKVESIVTASITGSMDDEAARWLSALNDIMYDRMAAAGLAPLRQSTRLEAWLDSYVNGRADVKSATAVVWGHTRRNLVAFFGADKPIREITEGDADAWRQHLIGKEGLSDNTVRRRCGIAKQFFRAAVRKKLIASNPFADLKAAIQANPKRLYFVKRDMAEKVRDACPDAEWRLIFSLCRYGGLRCPSELLPLTWADVDWERGRLRIHSPKTEHHPGGHERWIPIFPELVPDLQEVFDLTPPGTTHLINRYRDPKVNLRTELERIIARAGLSPWPKLFQNLRSTRETELAETWPEHVVCAWIGNSRMVARKHYLQVTDEHFAQASLCTARAAQNAAQQPAVGAGNDSQATAAPAPPNDATSTGCGSSRNDATPCEDKGLQQVGDTGLEPVTSRV